MLRQSAEGSVIKSFQRTQLTQCRECLTREVDQVQRAAAEKNDSSKRKETAKHKVVLVSSCLAWQKLEVRQGCGQNLLMENLKRTNKKPNQPNSQTAKQQTGFEVCVDKSGGERPTRTVLVLRRYGGHSSGILVLAPHQPCPSHFLAHT